MILATPVLEKLHHFFPEAEIDILVKSGMEKLFANHPFLNDILTWDKSSKFSDFFRLLKEVRKRSYDIVINMQRFMLTGLLTSLSGADARIGFSKNPVSFLFSRRISHEIGNGVHEIDRNLQLIKNITGEGRFMPRLYPSESDYARTAGFKSSPYLTLSPASLWFTKQFPLSKWIEFLRKIPVDLRVYLLGSEADRELCERIIRESEKDKMSSLAGELTFLESATLMMDAVMNYTNDSAPMHLASAVNAPVCAVFCSTIPDFGFGPLSDRSSIVETRKGLSCRPCGIHGYNSCPEKHFECALTIDPEQLTNMLGK